MGDLNSSNNMKDSAAISLGGQLMVGAIIVLFLLVVFFFFLHLYYRWLSRRNGQSLNWRTPVFHPVSESVRGLRRGLEPSIIQSIPVVIFHPDEFKDGLECSVCLCELSEGEKARLLPNCNHGFHLDCIDMWFRSHSTCPLCRNPVEIQVPEVNPEDGFSEEPRNFPTNVLFWGTPDQIAESGSSGVGENESTSSSSSATSASLEGDGRVVIEIPRQSTQSFSFPPPSSVQFAEEELKSPTALNRLKSLKRLLSGEKRVIPCSPIGSDVEQGLKVQSTQAASDS